jgi:hypothetical protein
VSISGNLAYISALEQIPAKLHDPGSRPGQAFADSDLLQHNNLARFLFGKAIPPCREARYGSEAEWIFVDGIQPETWISRQNSADVPALPRHYG